MRKILVGRGPEVESLMGGITDLQAGQGTHIHLAGEAGIGKSALLELAADEIDRRGMAGRIVVADESDRRRPLAVAATLFPDAGLQESRDPVGAAVAALERLVQVEPVALLADDLHWADEASLDVIRSVARRAPALGVLLVTAARRHPMPAGLRHLIASARNVGTVLELSPLTVAEIATLVKSRLGAEPGERLETLLGDTSGNPFLVCELLAALVAAGRLADDDGAIEMRPGDGLPPRLAASLIERIHLSAPDGAHVLLSASVLPNGFLPEELADVCGLPLEDVLAAASVLLAAGVFVDRVPGLSFRHELLRTAVQNASSETVRASLARHAGAILTARGAAPERLATCLLANVDPHDPTAVDQLVSAARGIGHTNPLAAADLLEHALGLLALSDDRNLPLSIELCWMLVAAGRANEATDLVEQRNLSTHGYSVGLERALGHALALSGRIDAAQSRSRGIDVDGVVQTGSPDDAEFVDGIGELAQLRVAMGELDQARRLIEWVDSSPTPVSTARAVSIGTARSYLHGIAGQFDESIEWARRARQAVADTTGGGVTAVSATLSMALSLDLGGDPDAALTVVRQPDLPGPHVRWASPLLQFVTGLILYRQGAWDDAITEANAGLLAADEVDLGLGVHWPYAVCALIHQARGELREADDWLARSRSVGSQQALGTEWLVYATAMAAEARGETEVAAATLELLAGGILHAGAPALLLACGPATVRLGLATGRSGIVDSVVGELDQLQRRSSSPVAAAIAMWTRGLCTRDADGIASAAEMLDGVRHVPESASAYHDGSLAALESQRVELARDLAARAFADYDEIGAELLHRRLRISLRDHGLTVRPRRSRRRATHGWAAITPSESTVVELVADGMTNTEIAGRLLVSRRTVESHLVRIYTKLGLTNRGQLAAAVHRRS